jgi:hypothetical protein
MQYALVISFAALGGIAAVLFRHRDEVMRLSDEEIQTRLKDLPYFFDELHEIYIAPRIMQWHEEVRPNIIRILLHGIETLLLYSRKTLSYIERRLSLLSDYVRGKREIHQTAKSRYWEELQNHKEQLNDPDE